MKAGVIFGLVCLVLVPSPLEAGPLTEEKEGNSEVVEW